MDNLDSLRTYVKKQRFDIGREIFISIVISAIITGAIAFYLDRKIDDRVAHRQFLYDFARTFFDDPKYRKVSIAIEEQYLYKKDSLSSAITDYELDDYLGFLNDIWFFYQDGFIPEDLLYRQYVYHLCIAYNSEVIENYRSKMIKEGFSKAMAYSFLDEMAEELGLVNQNCKEIST